MIRIVIVGEIGSGKSFASKSFGFPIFNADKEVSKMYNNNKKLFLKLQSNFPNFIKSYPVKKKEIANAIIKNKKTIKIISKIIHPIVRKKMNKFISRNKDKKAVVLDIPLYFENKINKKKDVVIYIYADKSKILKRLKLRKGFNFKIYYKLKKIQLKNENKMKKSNFYIKNHFNEKLLKKDINILKLKIFKK